MSTIIGLVSTFRLPLHPAASTSNPPLFPASFGLPYFSPPLESPIRLFKIRTARKIINATVRNIGNPYSYHHLL